MVNLTCTTVIVSLMAVAAFAAPYQELIPKPGYVAVYIREGDTALSEIHPRLAEAFSDDKSANIQLEDKTPKIVPEVNKSKKELKEQENTDEITPTNDGLKVEEVTASDIAEFDDVKFLANGKEPEKIVIPVEGAAQ